MADTYAETLTLIENASESIKEIVKISNSILPFTRKGEKMSKHNSNYFLKKRVTVLLVVILSTLTLSGCMKKNSSTGYEDVVQKESSIEVVEQSEEDFVDPKTDKEEEITTVEETISERDLFKEFLSGNVTLTTAPFFGEDDSQDNYDGFLSGEYIYPELKAAVERNYNSNTTTQYAIVDFGKDGTEELVMKFQNTDPCFLNWTGIIHANDGALELVYAYEDGYRIDSVLYESGYLDIGGSWSAGAHGRDYFSIDNNGNATLLFSSNYFYSSFATQIAYDLNIDGMGMDNDTDFVESLGEGSTLEIAEYVPGKRDNTGVKIVVNCYSENPEMKQKEEELVDKLIAMGAELITSDEMDSLCNIPEINGDGVEWTDWKEKCTIVKACELEYVYPEPTDYYFTLCDEDENAMKIMITTNKKITDVKVLSLTAEEPDSEGTFKFNTTVLDEYEQLTPDKPLVMQFLFAGDIPSYGISYIDEKGDPKVASINMSGYDGGVFMDEIEINNH